MKKMLAFLLSLMMVFGLTTALAAWPEKPINIVIPAGPGGDTDTTSRAIATSLTEILGVPVTVVNMVGGAGTVAHTEVQNSEADGYTVLYHHVDTLLLHLLDRMPTSWDENLDVSAVTGGGNTFCLFVHKDSPFQTLDDVAAYAKENPGELTFAVEAGGTIHMHSLAIQDALGVEFAAVDLGSAADRNLALLGNQVDILEAQYGQVADYIESGDFRVLTVLGNERNENFPDVPASIELGVPFDAEWFYFFGFKKGTDPAIIETFTAAVEEAVSMQPYTDALNIYNFRENFMAGDEAVTFMKGVEEAYAPVAAILMQE